MCLGDPNGEASQNVRFWHLADVREQPYPPDVRFTPKSGHHFSGRTPAARDAGSAHNRGRHHNIVGAPRTLTPFHRPQIPAVIALKIGVVLSL